MKNLGVNSRIITSLQYQVLLMDHAYKRTGEDEITLGSEENPSEATIKNNILGYSYGSDGLVIFNLKTDIFCYFDYSLQAIPYEHSQEFTDMFNRAKRVSVFYIPENTFGTIVRLK